MAIIGNKHDFEWCTTRLEAKDVEGRANVGGITFIFHQRLLWAGVRHFVISTMTLQVSAHIEKKEF